MATDSVTQHRQASPTKLRCAVMTLSTTRTKENDTGGGGIREELLAAGHSVLWYEIVKDDVPAITAALTQLRTMNDLDIIVCTGGTGISPYDVTIEAARPLFDKEIPAFSVMFAMLSREQVGMACLLSRATAGVLGNKVVFCLPGSPKACKLAMEKIIVPEAGHLVKHARERKTDSAAACHRPGAGQ
ncbi:MAG TPA: molybdenum cofactor biosynthesis protein B [Planctomycetota bacterium]|nr:molybdenum cofactor biosynthesis protein B [Planctomycetota bacterium]